MNQPKTTGKPGTTDRLSKWMFLLSALLLSVAASAQTYIPGKIVRPAGNSTAQGILDPNGDGFVSATTNGYSGQNDVAISNNELPYRPIYPFYAEPNSDLRRGPDKRFTDYVPSTIDKASYYMYFANGNIHFRVRMGSIIPGAKGYSFLIDIDGKFGFAGPLADPNYLPAATGVGGNPGFEIEVDLFTQASQTGIAVYKIDGKDKRNDFLPAAWSVDNWLEYSQVSMAATSDNGDPDYYVDFYIPLTALSSTMTFAPPTTPATISASTPLRIIPTTVMAPLPAVGGPKSDIYGLPDNLYPNANDEYIAMLGSMPSFTFNDFSSGGSGQSSTFCTAPPSINKVSSAASPTTVTGTWTPNNNAGAVLANVVITVYRKVNGAYTSAGSTTVTASSSSSTVSWSVSGVTVAAGDSFYAVAQAPGESACFESARVAASNCASRIAAPILDATICNNLGAGNTSSKGFTFNNKPSAWPNSFAKVANITRGTSATQTATAGTGITGTSTIQNANSNGLQYFREGATAGGTSYWDFSSGCSGGPGLSAGSYRFWVEDANGCSSGYTIGCVLGNGGNTLAGTGTSLAVPAITSPAGGNVLSSTTKITVSATQGTTVTFILNGAIQGTAVAANGATTTIAPGTLGSATFNIAAGTLSSTDRVQFLSEYTGAGVTTSYCGRSSAETTVSCAVEAPRVTTNSTSGLLQPNGSGYIQGSSTGAVSDTIVIYNAASYPTEAGRVVISNSNGSWTSSVLALSNNSYLVALLKQASAGGCKSDTASRVLYSSLKSADCLTAAITSYTTSYLNGTSYTGAGTTVTNGPPTSSTFAMNAFATTVSVSFPTSSVARLLSLYEDGNFVASTRVAANATTATFSNGTATGDNLGFYTGTANSTSEGKVWFTISDTSTALQTYLPESTCPNVGVVTCPVSTTSPSLSVANCPTCTASTPTSATVPSGGSLTFKLTGVSPNTIYALRSSAGVSYSNTYTVPANFSGNEIYLTSFPITGANNSTVQIEAVGTTVIVSNKVTVSCATTSSTVPVTLATATSLGISGTVFDDPYRYNIGGTPVQSVTNALGATRPLYVYLVNGSNTIVSSATVSATGTYSFTGLTSGATYKVVLDTLAGRSGLLTTSSIPYGWSYKAEGISGGTGDGTADGIYTAATLTASQVVDFGINGTPLAGNNTATSQVNPGGTNNVTIPATTFSGSDPRDINNTGVVEYIRITAFPAGATSITLTGATTAGGAVTTTTYTSGNFPSGGIFIAANTSGNPTSPVLVDPASSSVTSIDISYVTVDNGGQESAAATAKQPLTDLTVSGIVYHDGNALTDATINGTPIGQVTSNNVNLPLYANLVNAATGNVLAVAAVNTATGQYSFGSDNGIVSGGSYNVVLSTTQGTVGQPVAATLPATLPGWSFTGEGVLASGDNSPNGSYSTGTITTATQVNFGINARPTAGTNTVTAGTNPGGTGTYTIPNGSFNPTDVAPGTIASITITSFPTNTTTFTANGVTYTAASFAAAGGSVTVPFTSGNPTQAFSIDPIDGAVSPAISYTTTDNGGLISNNTGTLTLQFSTFNISGTVYHDANAGTINGTGIGSVTSNNVATQLYVNAVIGGNVVATATVAADGSYTLTGLNGGNYSIVLATSNSATTASLPSTLPGWMNTAEGTTAAGDGTANGTFSTGAITGAVTGLNFGINARPTAGTNTVTAGTNPGGTTNYAVPNGSFNPTDVNPGSIASITITSFPTNTTTFTAGGVTYTAASFAAAGGSVTVPFTGGNPTQAFSIDPIDGAVSPEISYITTDNGGLTSNNTGKLTLNFSTLSISGTVYHDANAGTIDGSGIGTVSNNGGSTQLYVNAVSGGTVIASATVAANGSYTLSGLNGGSYSVVLATSSSATTASLPATLPGWMNTAEGTTAAGDGSANGSYGTGAITASVSGLNFGINARPTAGSNTVTAGVNPGGTNSYTIPNGSFNPSDVSPGAIASITITSFPTNATSFTANGITYTAASFAAAGGAITVPFTSGNPTQAVSIDPIDGAVSPEISYTTTDNGGLTSNNTGKLTLNFSTLTLSGTVYHDANALTDNTINGTGTNLGGTLYVNAVSGGTVVGSATVAANGSWSIPGLNNGTYSLVLTNSNSNTAAALTNTYVFTGEGTASNGDGSVNGSTTIAAAASTSGINFGINARPTAGSNTVTAGVNPGGTNSYTIPNGAFNPTDVAPGTIASITITLFPTNATTFTAGGVTYTAASFAAAGGSVTVPFTSGNPAQAFSIDPIDGAVSPVISYTTTDNGGATSSNTGSLTLNFTTISISGTVYHDANGGTIDGSGIGTVTDNGGSTQLYVNAVSGGTVVATATVASNGSYTLTGLNSGSYSIVLATSNSATTASLPATLPGWMNTAEGITAAGDGSANGSYSTGAISSTVSGLNFGINARPTAGTNTVTAGANPGGTNTYTIPNGAFNPSDVAPGAIASITITSFPNQATSFTANGVTYTAASFAAAGGSVTVPFTSGNPTQPISIDPIDGAVSPVISYTTTDNGGLTSNNTGSLTLQFSELTISGTVYNDFTGGSINGNGAGTIGGTQLYVNLVNSVSGTWITGKALPANGVYSFGANEGVQSGVSYNVVLSTSPSGTSGLLPAGWVNTAEGTTAAGDGSANGLVSLGAISSNRSVNFGVNALPVADLKAYAMNPNTSSSVTLVNVPNSADPSKSYAGEIALSGTASSGNIPGAFTGTDADGDNGAALTLGAAVESVSLVIDPTTYAGTRRGAAYADALMLTYNGIQLQPGGCKGGDIGNPGCALYNAATAKWEIPVYDLSSLKLLVKNGTTTLGLSYAWKDAAGFTGSSNSYSIAFSSSLPLRLGTFTASARTESSVQLQWNTFDEVNTDRFEVEHSTDGRSFRAIGTVAAQGQAASASYSFLHTGAPAGNNYYRLRMIDRDATFTYSPVRLVTLGAAPVSAGFTLAPNPAQGGATRILWMGPTAKPVQVRVIDAAGRPVWTGSMGGSNLLHLSTIGWASGVYQVQLFQDGRSYQQQLLIP